MSIRDDACQLCTMVMKSPSREQVGDFIRRLNGTELGYIARKLNAQALGYLLVDQDREKLENIPILGQIPPLDDQERQLLGGFHFQLVQLNKQCVSPLIAELHDCSKAIDPYNRFKYRTSIDTHEGDVLIQKAINGMATSFHKHPAISVALDSYKAFGHKITESKYTESVCQLTDKILKEGVFKAPNDLTQIIFTENPDTPYRLIARHLIALLCVRASLAILDQMVYQAMLSDRLLLLAEDNIINIEGPSQHLVGSGLSVIYQPDQLASFVNLFDLVIVKCMSSHIPIDKLCRVEGIHFEYSKEFGHTIKVDLRVIDENLNPFGSLLEHI